MRYGLTMPNFGSYADPRGVAELARAAEAAGWDGLFVWDHVSPAAAESADADAQPVPFSDPWITLAAVALATERIRLGTMVTPLARRRPWVLARQIATLDHLSNGRLTLGVGLGFPAEEFSQFGEDAEPRIRAEKLDEALDVLAGLLSGAPFGFRGRHYTIAPITFAPAPVQERIPVWVAGMWPNRAPMRRAARWDGAFPIHADITPMTHADVRAVRDFVRAQRGADLSFDLILSGESEGDSPFRWTEPPSSYEADGATWWLETLTDWRGSVADMAEYVRRGPPVG